MLEVDIGLPLPGFALDIRFTSAGGVTALFGRSGTGKTTLVDCIAGLRRPARGRIVLDGQALFDRDRHIDLPAHHRRVGYVFQEARLFPHLTVRQNLLYGRWCARRRGGDGQELGRRGRAAGDRPTAGPPPRQPLRRRAASAWPSGGPCSPPLACSSWTSRWLRWTSRARPRSCPISTGSAPRAGIPIVYVSHAIDEVARLAHDHGAPVRGPGRRGRAHGPDHGPAGPRPRHGSCARPVPCSRAR